MNTGEQVPDFPFIATGHIQARLSDYRGQWVVLYFYPKDATPGCTIEARDFRDALPKLHELNARVYGISRDSLKSHDNFKSAQELTFELISDEDETICQLFDVMKMKSMYGKQMRGIERSTFLINPEGNLQQAWRKVRVIGHVEEVAAVISKLTRE